MRLVVLFAFISLALCVDIAVKHLAGPPEEFPTHALPSPVQSAQVASSAAFYMTLLPSDDSPSNVLKFTTPLLVDSSTKFSFVFFSPHEEILTLSLTDPFGHPVSLHGRGAPTWFAISPDTHVNGTIYTFLTPFVGKYTLDVKTQELEKSLFDTITQNSEYDGYILLYNENTVQVHSYLTSYHLHVGSSVGIVARTFDTPVSGVEMQSGVAPTPLDTVTTALMSVTLPDGNTIDTPMHDDGLNGDIGDDDGIYAATVTAFEPGTYILQASLTGTYEGAQFIRTTQQLVTVVEPSLTLTGTAIGDVNENIMTIYVLVDAPINNKYRVYAEVWGRNADNQEVPIAWVGGMAFVQPTPTANDALSYAMELDLNWVSRAGAQDPLVLKNIVVQDINAYVPIVESATVPITTTGSLKKIMKQLYSNLVGLNGEITEEMRVGRRPAFVDQMVDNANATDATGKLILVHGYCSNENPFTVYPEDFTNAAFFLNAGANLGHDAFAQKVLEFVAQNNYGPFAFVGHSQGGAVGLHILNYYWSGLDGVINGRLVQSVGSPYQGCGAAGSAADLGKIFGVLCGGNTDLSKDGAKLWLAGIQSARRAQVYYYTSTYKQGQVFGDYCNLATQLVLAKPNDGISEYDYAQLPGGNNMGNKEQWCHSTGMKYTAQTQDRTRNVEMNGKAARVIKPK